MEAQGAAVTTYYPAKIGNEEKGHLIPCDENFKCAGCKQNREENWFHLFTFDAPPEPGEKSKQVPLCRPGKNETYKEKTPEGKTPVAAYKELREKLKPPRDQTGRSTAPAICNCVLEHIKTRLGKNKPVYLPRGTESTMEQQVQALKAALVA